MAPSRLGVARTLRRIGTAGLLVMLGASGAIAQQGPIRLFPPLQSDQSAPAPRVAPAEPAPITGPTATDPAGPRPAPGPAAADPERTDGSVRVVGLDAPEVDAIGLTGLTGGFGPGLWQGSDPELVLAMLAELPVAGGNPPLQALTRRLLATAARLPGAPPGQLLEVRVERLLASGDLDTAAALLEQLPSGLPDAQLTRWATEVDLLLAEDERACRRANDIGTTNTAPFWAKAVVICRLASGDRSGAGLGLDLLRDAGHGDDAAFLELAGMLVDDDIRPLTASLTAPSAFHIALLRLAGQAAPESALGDAPAVIVAAVARDPRLAGDRQLALAERAWATRGIATEILAAIYRDTGEAGADGGDFGGSPEGRADAYASLQGLAAPEARAELLDAVWRRAGADRFLVAAAFGEGYADLPPQAQLTAAAPNVTRALLAADRPILAVRWFALLTGARAGDARTRDAAIALVPLFAMAGVGGSDAVPELNRDRLATWRAQTEVSDADARQTLALLEGVGAPVPLAAWWDLGGAATATGVGAMPPPPISRGLERAVASERLGETVALALHALGGSPESAHPEAVIAGLRALAGAGLIREARAIAVAAALTRL